MKPITREEYYLAKIAGTWQGKTPEPVTIEEYYLATMAGDYSGNTPQPVTRLQYYMAKAAGVWGGSIPAPVTRLEYYWAAIAGKEGHIPDPVTRQEYLLYAISQSNNDVINTVFGATIIINDAAEGRPFRGLRVFGKSTQVRTTGAQLLPEQAVSNYFISLNGNIVGKNNSDYSKIIQNTENTTYYIFRKNVGTRFRAAYVDAIPTGNTPCTGVVDDTKDNISITVPAGKVLIINMEDTKAFDGLMVQKTRDRLPYEPYTGGKPSPSPEYPQEIVSAGESGTINVSISDSGSQSQSLTLATPNGLPGVPVSKDGNYTDSNGQQWVCDEIDLERGKYVQRVKEVNPADYDDWILDDSTEPIRFKVNRIPDTINERKRFEVLSNRFVFNSENKVGVSFAYADEIYFYLPSTVTTVEQAKQWFVDNPTTLMYMLGTPIEINLTPEEIAAYKALRTYGPTTVVSSDAGVHMEVTYVAER